MMMNNCSLPCSLHYFDDLIDIGHGILGWIAAYSGYGPLVSLGFLAYQMAEVEPLSNKMGDLGEYFTGYLAETAFRRSR